MNTQKKELKNIFIERLPELIPQLSPAVSSRATQELAEEASSFYKESHAEMTTALQETIMQLESTRGYLASLIDTLEEQSKKTMQNFLQEGMIWYETDPKSRKQRMMAKTKVLGYTVEYFNKMNELVSKYYSDIAPIPQPDRVRENAETSSGGIQFRQGKLF